MRAALFNSEPQFELIERDLRPLRDDEVLLKICMAGICGTDVKILAGHSHANPPVILGHEFCGHIVQAGKKTQPLAVDDFVSVDPNIYCGACRFCRKGKMNLCENLQALGVDIDGGFAEYCIVPARQCYKLPDNTHTVSAALLEPLSCALYGIQRAGIRPGEDVLIIGSGMIGIIMTQLARLAGAANIIVTDTNPARLRVAQNAGADFIFDPAETETEKLINELTHGGADVVLECVGSTATVKTAIRLGNYGARIIIFGVSPMRATMEISPYEVYRKDLAIMGSFLNPFTFRAAVQLISTAKLKFDNFNFAMHSLSEINSAIESHRTGNYLKTFIDMYQK